MESYFNHGNNGFLDTYFAWLNIVDGGVVYPTADCDVTVTATVTCGGEEIGVVSAVAHVKNGEF